MTTKEVFEKITSEPKWYGGAFSPQSASRIVRQHKLGAYKNYDWLFSKFGYKINTDKTWVEK